MMWLAYLSKNSVTATNNIRLDQANTEMKGTKENFNSETIPAQHVPEENENNPPPPK